MKIFHENGKVYFNDLGMSLGRPAVERRSLKLMTVVQNLLEVWSHLTTCQNNQMFDVKQPMINKSMCCSGMVKKTKKKNQNPLTQLEL